MCGLFVAAVVLNATAIGASSSAEAAAQARPTTVLVLPIGARDGVTSSVVELTTAMVAGEIRRHAGYRVVTWREIEGTLTQEQQRQAAGCDSFTCAAEIAGSMNTDEIVLGSLGKIGASYVLSLSRIAARNASVVGSCARRVTGNDDSVVLDVLPSAVSQLMGGSPSSAGSPENVTSPAPTTSRLPLALRGAGVGAWVLGCGLLVGGVGLLVADAAWLVALQYREVVSRVPSFGATGTPRYLQLVGPLPLLGAASVAFVAVAILAGIAGAAAFAGGWLVPTGGGAA